MMSLLRLRFEETPANDEIFKQEHKQSFNIDKKSLNFWKLTSQKRVIKIEESLAKR